MTPEQVAEQLGDARAQELLGTARVARIAYVARDVLPRVVPVGFHWDGERIFFCTADTAPKVAALQERPEMAVTIEREPGAMQSLQLRGVADVEIVDGIPDEYLAATSKSMDAEQAAAFEVSVRNLYARMARISFVPRWARLYDFEQGRVPGFLQRLLDRQTG
jgi:Pyridoxamine 5'-phosphate oxidase